MSTNLSNQLAFLSADQLSTIDYEAGVDKNYAVVPNNFDDYLAKTPNAVVDTWGSGSNITVGFSSSSAAYNFTSVETDGVWQALQLWAGMTGVTFTYVSDPTKAKIDIVHAFDTFNGATLGGGTSYKTLLHNPSPIASVDYIDSGRIQLDGVTKETGGTAPAYGLTGDYTTTNGYGIGALMHEIGHLLGLGHTGPYNGTVDPSTQQRNATDVRDWSLMSYIDPTTDQKDAAGNYQVPKYSSTYPVTANYGNESPFTPMGLDIIAAQRLDGAPTSTMFSGNNTFGFNSNIKYTGLDGNQHTLSMYDFSIDKTPIVTLYDYGTNNKLDLSGFSSDSTVNLNDGTFSSVDGLTSNIFIEWGTQIDRVVGGSGTNVFTLNLRGDFVDGGGGGNNTAILPGPRGAYTLGFSGADPVLTQISNGQSYTLHNIQHFQFGGGGPSQTLADVARVNWTGAVSNHFGIAGNWSNNTVPDLNTAVAIGLGAAVVVTAQDTNQVDSLTLANGASIDITSGHFIVDNSISDSTNAGIITVEGGTTLYLSGGLVNTGALLLTGAGGTAQLITNGALETFSGGGSIIMDAGGVIGGRAPNPGYDTVVNTDNTIEGAGTIGRVGFAYPVNFRNEAGGTVSANGAGTLLISAPTVNNGLLTAQGSTLDITGPVDQTAGGAITATSTGSHVLLDGGTITGGSLSATGGGTIEISTSTTLAGPMAIQGTITVDAGATLTLLGDIYDVGVIDASLGHLDVSGAHLHGGTIKGAGGTLQLTGSGATLDGSQLAAGTAGVVDVIYGQVLTLKGAISNTGMIKLDGNAYNGVATLLASGTVTLSGGGSVALLDTYNGTGTATAVIKGTVATDEIDNVDNTLTGYGKIGAGTLTLVNEAGASIFATANSLTVDTGATAIVNHGLMQGLGGNLLLASAVTSDGRLSTGGTGTLTLDQSVTNNGVVQINQGGKLVLAGGALAGTGFFNMTSGASGEVTSTGTIDATQQTVQLLGSLTIDYGAVLITSGAILNSGSIAVNGNAYNGAATLKVAGTTTLSGAGTVSLNDLYNGTAATVAVITGSSASDVLDNVDNVIFGYGEIGHAAMSLTNEAAGTIDAIANTLTVDTGATAITNKGLLVGAIGTLVVNSAVVNTGTILARSSGKAVLHAAISGSGSVTAVDNSTVVLAGAVLGSGQVVSSTAKGAIEVSTTGTIDGTVHTEALAGSLAIDYGAVLTTTGAIANSGTIAVNGNAYNGAATLKVAGTTTLSGAGTVSLNDLYNGTAATVAVITGASTADLLDNVDNVISGYGEIGHATMSLANEAAGTIDANANTLTLDTGATAITNKGLLVGAIGTLVVNSAVVNTGTILARSSGKAVLHAAISGSGSVTAVDNSTVVLAGAVLGSGQVVSSTAKGTIEVATTGTIDGTAHTQALAGTLAIDYGAVLTTTGAIANSGTIAVNGNAYNGAATLKVAGTTTLSGAGTVSLNDLYNGTGVTTAVITGGSASDMLDNVDNAISGYGQIGGNAVAFTNEAKGVVTATANSLTLSTGATRNAGLMQATGGTLVIESAVYNTGGRILAAGGTVQLGGATAGIAATITGGALASSGTGVVTVGNAGATLDGGPVGPVSSTAAITVATGAVLTAKWSVSNAGSITLNGNAYNGAATLHVSNTLSLSGGGTIGMIDLYNGTGSAAAVITGGSAADTLDNVDNTIHGYGEIGAGKMSLTNEAAGVVDATANTLTIDTGSTAVINHGLLEGLGGTLSINSLVTNSGTLLAGAASTLSLLKAVNNTGSVQVAAGGRLVLAGGAISGTGTLAAAAGGTVEVTTAGLIDGQHGRVTLAGSTAIDAGASLTLQGAIVNTGSLAVNGNAYTGAATLRVSGTATLSGGGTVNLVDVYNGTGNTAAAITGGSAADLLDNVDNTIQGYGELGGNAVAFTNEAAGVVNASANTLTLNTGATRNLGVMKATGGTLVIDASVANAGGQILAAGGIVQLGGATGATAATITGGALASSGTGVVTIGSAGATLDGGPVGPVRNTAAITVDAGRVLTATSSISNAGSIAVNGNAYSGAATLHVTNTLSLSGGGSISMVDVYNGTGNTAAVITGGSAADLLDNVDNTIHGYGVFGAGAMSFTNEASGVVDATSNTLAIDTGAGAGVNHGLLEATGTGTLTVASGLTNSGTIDAAGGTVLISATVTNTGTLEAGTGGTLTLAKQASGTLKIDAGGTLVLQAGAAPGATLDFTGTGGTLKLAAPTAGAQPFAISIAGSPIGNTADFAGVSATIVNAGGVATVSAGGVVLGTLTSTGGSGYTYSAASDGNGGTLVTAQLSDPLFDPAYYLAQNTDVAAAGVDPYQHYMTTGWKEGRNPDALFNTRYYLNQNADVAAAGVNPLAHFETYGWHEGRDPSVLFSLTKYDATYTDVAAAGVDPLEHYIEHGKAEGRTDFAATPHPTAVQDPAVDYAYYYAQHPAVAAAGLDASADYHSTGWALGYNPNAYFDTNYYLTQNPDVKAAGVDPLTHFETYGWLEGRAPSLVFSDSQYLATYTDVAAAGVDPLVHYLDHGLGEGRMSFIAGGTAAADPLVNAAYYDQQLGATLIPAGAAGQQQAAFSYDATGWQKGLNPDALFDTNYYLSHNPDVAAAHMDPLQHYETYGWREGRDPSAQFSTNKYLGAYADVKAANLDPLLHYVEYGQGEGRTAFHV